MPVRYEARVMLDAVVLAASTDEIFRGVLVPLVGSIGVGAGTASSGGVEAAAAMVAPPGSALRADMNEDGASSPSSSSSTSVPQVDVVAHPHRRSRGRGRGRRDGGRTTSSKS
jgi:hypothetical protein